MKNKLGLFIILLLLFAGFIGARFFIFNQGNVYGRIKVLSSPNASVFINNLAVGKTPYEDKYKEGEYLVKLIPEGNATETASWQGKVPAHKNTLTYVNRDLGTSDVTSAGEIFSITKMDKPPKNKNYGEIAVETEPMGAIVYLDNDEKGVAPVILQDVIKGDHELSVFMPGFIKRTAKINVEGGYKFTASFKLAIDQSQKRQSEILKEGEEKKATESAETKKTTITIKGTPDGWLRVREEPSVTASEAARVNEGDDFEVLDEKSGWYKINYEDKKSGWISGRYTKKTE